MGHIHVSTYSSKFYVSPVIVDFYDTADGRKKEIIRELKSVIGKKFTRTFCVRIPKIWMQMNVLARFETSFFAGYVSMGNKSRLLFSPAEMFKKPLWQTVWTQNRLLL